MEITARFVTTSALCEHQWQRFSLFSNSPLILCIYVGYHISSTANIPICHWGRFYGSCIQGDLFFPDQTNDNFSRGILCTALHDPFQLLIWLQVVIKFMLGTSEGREQMERVRSVFLLRLFWVWCGTWKPAFNQRGRVMESSSPRECSGIPGRDERSYQPVTRACHVFRPSWFVRIPWLRSWPWSKPSDCEWWCILIYTCGSLSSVSFNKSHVV